MLTAFPVNTHRQEGALEHYSEASISGGGTVQSVTAGKEETAPPLTQTANGTAVFCYISGRLLWK